MKAYVSIDAEGLPGVGSLHFLLPRGALYGEGREIFTSFASATARKLLALGAEEVLVADSHGTMSNVKYLELPEGVKLLQGYPRLVSMVNGVAGHHFAVFVGYHAAAGGPPGGFLSHTYGGSTIQRVRVDGRPVSEFYLNALVAGKYGVPVVLVAGDERLAHEVARVSSHIVFVPLNSGVGRYAAVSRDLARTLRDLEAGLERAVKAYREGRAEPLRRQGPMAVQVEVKDAGVADMAEAVRGVRRADEYTVELVTEDPEEALRFVELVAWLGLALRSLTSP